MRSFNEQGHLVRSWAGPASMIPEAASDRGLDRKGGPSPAGDALDILMKTPLDAERTHRSFGLYQASRHTVGSMRFGRPHNLLYVLQQPDCLRNFASEGRELSEREVRAARGYAESHRLEAGKSPPVEMRYTASCDVRAIRSTCGRPLPPHACVPASVVSE